MSRAVLAAVLQGRAGMDRGEEQGGQGGHGDDHQLLRRVRPGVGEDEGRGQGAGDGDDQPGSRNGGVGGDQKLDTTGQHDQADARSDRRPAAGRDQRTDRHDGRAHQTKHKGDPPPDAVRRQDPDDHRLYQQIGTTDAHPEQRPDPVSDDQQEQDASRRKDVPAGPEPAIIDLAAAGGFGPVQHHTPLPTSDPIAQPGFIKTQ